MSTLLGRRVLLRPLTRNDFSAWREVRRRNRARLKKWEPQALPGRPDTAEDPRAFADRCAARRRERQHGAGYGFGVFVNGCFRGEMNLSSIQRGPVLCRLLRGRLRQRLHPGGAQEHAPGRPRTRFGVFVNGCFRGEMNLSSSSSRRGQMRALSSASTLGRQRRRAGRHHRRHQRELTSPRPLRRTGAGYPRLAGGLRTERPCDEAVFRHGLNGLALPHPLREALVVRRRRYSRSRSCGCTGCKVARPGVSETGALDHARGLDDGGLGLAEPRA